MTPLELARRTWRKAVEHELLTRAAAAAYYALSALFPSLALLVTMAAHLVPDISGPPNSPRGLSGMSVDEFGEMVSKYLPKEAYEVIAAETLRIQKQPPIGLLSVGLVMCLWLSSGFSGAIIDAMNRIHGRVETRSYLTLTLLAIALTVLQVAIVLGTLTVLVVWPQITAWLGEGRAASSGQAMMKWIIVAFGVFLSFTVTSYLGPNVHRRWQWIRPGSVFGTVVVLFAGLLLRLYVQYFGNYGKTYGSLGGVMLLSLWFWIAALTVLLAVQINKIIDDEKETTAP